VNFKQFIIFMAVLACILFTWVWIYVLARLAVHGVFTFGFIPFEEYPGVATLEIFIVLPLALIASVGAWQLWKKIWR